MSKFYVTLASVHDAKQFAEAASHYPCAVDVRSDAYVVNAKSIMGLFSLDLSHPLQVEVRGTQAQEEAFHKDVAGFECLART